MKKCVNSSAKPMANHAPSYWIEPRTMVLKACLDCVTMIGGLIGAILTTLIIGL
jgi:hypothetical protein